MPNLSKRLLIPSVIVFSVLLSGCQFGNQLTTSTPTQQVTTAPKTWQQQSNNYTTTISYDTPGGLDSNTITLTIQNGVIKTAKVDVFTQIPESVRYQEEFAQQLPSLIVGKRVSDLTSLDTVSGASLTTAAFNDALLKLQQQLKS